MAYQRIEVNSPAGIIKDKSPTDIPMEAWSDGANVLFNNGKATKAYGHLPVFGTPSGAPYWSFPVIDDDILTWYYATDSKIYKYFGQAHVDVTRTASDYGFDIDIGWNGGTLNGLPVANNGIDVPQIVESADNEFKDLPNWPSTLRARVIKPFKNYLVALNLVSNSSELSHSLRWSSPADPGFAPPSWDIADPTEQAGQVELADSSGRIVGGVPLKDNFIIYKEDAVYAMRFIGGLPVFQFKKLFSDIGAVSTHSISEFEGKHFVVGVGDIYVHDGINKKSVADSMVRDFFYSTVDNTYFHRVHTVVDRLRTEIWICFPNKDSLNGQCNFALIWNWGDNTWAVRTLPNTYYATAGIIDPDAQTATDIWDNSEGSWDDDVSSWNEGTYNPAKQKLMLLSPWDTKMFLVDRTSLFDTEIFTSTLERSGMDFEEPRQIKYINSVAPQVTGAGILDIFVGSQMIEGAGIAWKGPYPYEIGVDYKIDCRASGRFIAVKFQSDSSASWEINGYTMEIDTAGED